MTRGDPTDLVLVPLAQQGDVTALAALFQRHRGHLYAVAISMLRDREEAADAVQDAFVSVMTRLSSLRDAAAIDAWLRAIVMNVCRMRLRRQSPVTLDHLPDLPDPRLDPERIITDLRLRDWIWSALAVLSEDDRTAVLLRHFTRCTSYQAIAEVTAVPIGTVRSRLHRGHARLADVLQHTETAVSHDQHRLEVQRRSAWMDFYDIVSHSPEPATYQRMFHSDVTVRDSGVLRTGINAWVAEERPAIELGVRAAVVGITAATDLTILEVDFINPPEAPRHCPPRSTFVHRVSQERTTRLAIQYV